MKVTEVQELMAAQTEDWHKRHKQSMRTSGVTMLEHRARSAMMLIGPKVAADTPFAIRHCTKCTPPPEVYQCPACDAETTEAWQYDVHLALNPKYCRERADRKARKWASRV